MRVFPLDKSSRWLWLPGKKTVIHAPHGHLRAWGTLREWRVLQQHRCLLVRALELRG